VIDSEVNGRCSCGHARFHIQGEPLVRAFCHCTICQEFNQAGYADITIFRERDVTLPNQATLKYISYAFPPMLQRGKCLKCRKPVIEYLSIPPLPKLIIVPSGNITDKTRIPEPSLHLFYHSRVADINDLLPKKIGYIKSQLALCHKMITKNKGRS
jgi:hypothetical protein